MTLVSEYETDIPVQTIDLAQSHGDLDSHASLPAQSPKPREESSEVLITGARTLYTLRIHLI